MNYNDQLKTYRILAFKCANEIRQTASIKMYDSIEESSNENRFLNLSVWIDSIQRQLDQLKLVDKLSTESYRTREGLDD